MFNVYNRYTDTAGNLHFTDCRSDGGAGKECQYITEDKVWERFVIVRRMWMKYNGREPQEVQE